MCCSITQSLRFLLVLLSFAVVTACYGDEAIVYQRTYTNGTLTIRRAPVPRAEMQEVERRMKANPPKKGIAVPNDTMLRMDWRHASDEAVLLWKKGFVIKNRPAYLKNMDPRISDDLPVITAAFFSEQRIAVVIYQLFGEILGEVIHLGTQPNQDLNEQYLKSIIVSPTGARVLSADVRLSVGQLGVVATLHDDGGREFLVRHTPDGWKKVSVPESK
jgi:hypothetical protein